MLPSCGEWFPRWTPPIETALSVSPSVDSRPCPLTQRPPAHQASSLAPSPYLLGSRLLLWAAQRRRGEGRGERGQVRRPLRPGWPPAPPAEPTTHPFPPARGKRVLSVLRPTWGQGPGANGDQKSSSLRAKGQERREGQRLGQGSVPLPTDPPRPGVRQKLGAGSAKTHRGACAKQQGLGLGGLVREMRRTDRWTGGHGRGMRALETDPGRPALSSQDGPDTAWSTASGQGPGLTCLVLLLLLLRVFGA